MAREGVRERDEEIARLRAELAQRSDSTFSAEIEHLRVENERLGKQLQLLRQEHEAKVERLNARLRELSGGAAPAPVASTPEGERKGFFRR